MGNTQPSKQINQNPPSSVISTSFSRGHSTNQSNNQPTNSRDQNNGVPVLRASDPKSFSSLSLPSARKVDVGAWGDRVSIV